MLFSRQRQLLCLLDALGGSAGKVDFQKLLFLYSAEPTSGKPYDFVPYKFGAFSFTSYADRRKLIERGLLVDDEQTWELTEDGRRIVGGTADFDMGAFAQRYSKLRGNDLVAHTYRRFPYSAIRSEIVDRVLKGDPEALSRVASARSPQSGASVHTIGYEGHTLESYLNALLQSGVRLLCDVRRNPISRKYGFSKTALARGCEGVGIRYEHLPELGISSDQRRGLDTQADYDALFAEYEQNWLPTQAPALEQVKTWVDEGERVALTCYEHLPHQCHRHCVAKKLVERFGPEFNPAHL